ncbi:MAG: DUF3035 domain-containing protein [Alphaproteobacteria bacterium]
MASSLRTISVAAALAAMLSACGGNVGEVLGLDSKPPDEFSVVKRAPLTLPPDYGLRPPEPGKAERNAVTPRDNARQAVLGTEKLSDRDKQKIIQARRAAGQDESELALLNQADALNASPEIRQVVNEESQALAEEQESFVDDLLFWKEVEPPGAVVDATGENQRLQENAGLGKPVTEGATPTIQRESETSPFKWPF